MNLTDRVNAALADIGHGADGVIVEDNDNGVIRFSHESSVPPIATMLRAVTLAGADELPIILTYLERGLINAAEAEMWIRHFYSEPTP